MTIRTMLAATAALALFSLSAIAQTSAPAPVGVTPQTAEKANEKAIQRNDTGTVVRTAPPVTERANTTSPPGAAPAAAPQPSASNVTSPRPPRADRG